MYSIDGAHLIFWIPCFQTAGSLCLYLFGDLTLSYQLGQNNEDDFWLFFVRTVSTIIPGPNPMWLTISGSGSISLFMDHQTVDA